MQMLQISAIFVWYGVHDNNDNHGIVYELANVLRQLGLLQWFSQVLSRCIACTIDTWTIDEEFLDIHNPLQVIIAQLQC